MSTPSAARKTRKEITGEARERLEEARQRILEQYQRDVREGQESGEEASQDMVDRATSSYNREFLFTRSGDERQILQQIEEALARLDEGTYGNCANCGTPIGEARLDAVPWARFCVSCQELQEQGLLQEE